MGGCLTSKISVTKIKKFHHERKKKTNSQLKTNLWEINKFPIENASGLELYSADYKQNSCCRKSVQL